MVLTDPATDQYADGRAARVWQMYIGGTSTRTLKYKTFLTDILRRHNCKTVFDVACGTGVDSIMLLEEGFEVQSADISDKMLKQAYETRWKRRKDDIFDRWVIEEANWLTLEDDMDDSVPEDGYDAIICMGNSFAHLPDYHGDNRDHVTAIKQFYNLLKPGGILVIDHRNYDYILDYGKAPSHNIYYDSSNIVDLKTSILYENGAAALIQLDYHMDVSSLKKPTKKKSKKRLHRISEEKYHLNGDSHFHIYGEADEVRTVSNNKQLSRYRAAVSESSAEETALEKIHISEKTTEEENYTFKLSYYPHRLANFTKLLKSVFGSAANYECLADFKPMRSEPNPAYYMHIIQKVK